MNVVLALEYRNVGEQERRENFLVEEGSVGFFGKLSHFNVRNYLWEFVQVVVAVGSDQLSCEAFLSKLHNSFRTL